MADTKEKKGQKIASSEDFGYLNKKIRSSTLSSVQRKTKEEIAREMKAKKEGKEAISAQQENKQKFLKILFLNLKDTEDNNKIANNYLFEIIKDTIKKDKAYNGLYKIDVIKKEKDGIICRIVGGTYQKKIVISNEQMMKKKKKEDTLKGDFLEEIQYGDSIMIDVQGDVIRKIYPDNIIEEIGNYIKKNDNSFIKAKKIQTAMKFFNESKEQLSSEYIQKFFKFVRSKESERNKGKPVEKIENYKEHFAQVIKKYLNQEKHYVHRENDIDKSSLMFLLDKFGIKLENKIYETSHDDIKNIDSGVFWDVGETTNGIEIKDKTVGINKKGEEIKKKKIIVSEHTDGSNKAILTNRPSSTTQMIFKIAKELGAIDKEQLPQIERFVNFVNTVDSMDYQISSIDYKHNYQTVFGLYRSMNIEDIFEYFKNSEHSGFEKLPEWYMKKTKTITRDGRKSDILLQEISEKHKERIEKNIDNFEKIKDSGKELVYGNTKFIVEIEEKPENRIQDGPQTSGYNGYGFFNIKAERGNIYIYSPKKFPVTIEGFPTDGHFLIINNPTEEDLEKLFQKFSTENSTLKKDIIKRLSTIQTKKEEQINEHDFSSKCKLFLPELTKKDLKIGKKYTAIINNDPQNKIAFGTLDSKETIKGRIKVEDKNLLKGYKKGSTIHVKIDEIPEEDGKLLSLSLVV